MEMPRNEFKRMLREKRLQVGLFVALANTYSMEILATAGFDWLLIDGEHAPNNPATVLPQLQAAAPYPVQLVVRPVNHDTALIKQYLDIGAQTLLVPMVESVSEAAALVRAVRYPPQGMRGVGTSLARAARWNAVRDYAKHANDEICLIVQIESRQGLANLDAILMVEGVDGIFIGPADLAASMGYLGQSGHPEVKAAIEDAVKRIAATGKAAGVFVSEPKLARHYLDCGASFIAVGGDVTLLRTAALKLAASFRDPKVDSGGTLP
ncbi:4-hydroxy-2-oxoheptanedioate aldolase [Sulfuritalea hydrogenivorans]|uniref:2,4-dihydroxyhept-2-ene-1,7-dioic acid aldolase n=1 Tax=Sulfuritalea hydrogenivorans sk43H TaxID=1223802 RepID=W0SER2_9PROT|nr:4-hydroxy-2-oxoheptanedioate aldolase [Sulfuritalea hydrogenivorans]BAO29526.1 2,4-dihydroxyhept-2-ene-1,7-dioic acid aldolase [Sulfuritalea hydrogenivorans sk43H]